MKPEIQMSENIIRTLIKSVGLNKFAVALNNTLHYKRVIRALINSLSFYTSCQAPCFTCSAAEDINSCRIYGERCVKCSLYARWSKIKKNSHNTIQMNSKFSDIDSKYFKYEN